MSEQHCGYELCQKPDPIEVIPGHRVKQFHDENCRQAQHRLRKEREQTAKKTNLEYYLTKYQSPLLCTIVERVLREQGAPDLLRLVTAIDDECRHAQASEQMQQRVAYLEIQLSEYRAIVDLDDRARIAQQFMAMGQLLDYRALDKFKIGQGLECWEDYRSWTSELTLAEVVVYGRDVLSQEMAAREQAESRSELRQAEQEIQALRLQVQELERKIEKKQQRAGKQQMQLKELQVGRAEWTVWKEAEIRGSGDLTAMRRYLQEHLEAAIPITRNGVTVRIMGLGEDAVAVSEDHGIIRLNDDELQQGRVWVCKHMGVPIIATRLPIGDSAADGQHRLQMESELAAAQSEIQALQRELDRYQPPPRALLECSLRRWSTLTKIFFHDKALAGDELDTFIKASSDRRLLEEITSAQRCYFIGKLHQQRIGVIAEAIEKGAELLYRGEHQVTGIDEQGYITLDGVGDRTWLTIDAVQMFWSLIIAQAGQHHVGGNAEVAGVQQYLCDHPGEAIAIRRGNREEHIVFLDDDALAVSEKQRCFKLYEDELGQAHAWIKSKRDEKSVSR